MMDKIILNNLQFYGYHGVFPEENKLGQRFHVDLQLHLCLKKAGETDDMNESIDYGNVYEVVQENNEGEARDLLESVDTDIGRALFETFVQLEAGKHKVSKTDPPIQEQTQ